MYLEVQVDGNPVNYLLDTGSKFTLILGNLLQELLKKPVTSQIGAVNATIVKLLGLVSLPMMLQGKEFLINDVAFVHIGEMLLGIDWLEEQLAIWDMCRGELYMQVSVFPLTAMQGESWVRRVVV